MVGRVPVQEGLMRVKSPVVVAEVIVTGLAGDKRLASVKVIGAEVLWTLTGPKSCEMGLRSRP